MASPRSASAADQLNPGDNQGARFIPAAVEAGKTWGGDGGRGAMSEYQCYELEAMRKHQLRRRGFFERTTAGREGKNDGFEE